MNAPPLSVRDVARYLLAIADEGAGDRMTLLKLQKLLYDAQGFYLAMHDGEPLFADPIEARDNGPVLPRIEEVFGDHGEVPIGRLEPFDPQDYPPEVREILDAVYRVYGPFTARELSDLTHREAPWLQTPRRSEIDRRSLVDFFRTLIEAGRSGTPIDREPLWPSESFRHQRRTHIMRSAPRRDRLGAILDRVPSPDPWADAAED